LCINVALTTFKGHSKLLEVALFDPLHMTSSSYVERCVSSTAYDASVHYDG